MPVALQLALGRAEGTFVVDGARLKREATRVLQLVDRRKGVVSVTVVDDAAIWALNRQWRGVDSPTDVLSFSQLEGPSGVASRALGDVVISVETAARQAAQVGHGLAEELQVLLVHGILHLIGYDHIEPSDAVVMRAKEAALLQALASGAAGLIDRAHAEAGS